MSDVVFAALYSFLCKVMGKVGSTVLNTTASSASHCRYRNAGS